MNVAISTRSSLLLAVALLVALPGAALAQGQSATLTASTVSTAAPGQTIAVTVALGDLVNVGTLSAIKFAMNVDPYVLEPVDAVPGAVLSGWPAADFAYSAETGRLVVTAITDPAVVISAGELMTLHFAVRADAVDGAMSDVAFGGVVETDPPILLEDPASPVTGIKVATVGASVSVSGGLTCMSGDANPDMTLDTADAIVVLRIVTGLIADPSGEQICGADANGDESIDTGDAVWILRTIVGLPVMRSMPSAPAVAWIERTLDGARLVVDGASAAHGLQAELRADAWTTLGPFAPAEHGMLLSNGDASHQVVAWASTGALSDGDVLTMDLPVSGTGEVALVSLRLFDAGGEELVLALRDGAPSGDVVRSMRLGNSPNPFNPRTSLSFDLPRAQRVRLELFNSRGERVAVLVDGELPAGANAVVWDGTDEDGRAVSSGVYFARLRGTDGEARHRLLLVR